MVPAECNARTEGGEMQMVLGGARGEAEEVTVVMDRAGAA